MAHARQKIDPENVAAAEKMVEDIKMTYVNEFEKSDWMDDESKAKALEKIKNIKTYVAYPKHLADENDTYLKSLFDKFNILPTDTILETAIKILSSYSEDYFLAPFRNETLGFIVPIFDFNAAYLPPTNSLMISSLLVRSPSFDAALPDYYNLGAFGVIVGHEIGHAYDPGSSKKVWSNKTRKEYKARTKCIANQFDQFDLFGRKVDGAKTSKENVADSLGVKTAFNTMRKKLIRKTENEVLRLPGLQHFTPEQTFFYSFANFWCGIPIKPSSVEHALDDVHSPGMFRVNGVVSNSDEFAKAFNCKPNSPMNPTKKCKIL